MSNPEVENVKVGKSEGSDLVVEEPNEGSEGDIFEEIYDTLNEELYFVNSPEFDQTIPQDKLSDIDSWKYKVKVDILQEFQERIFDILEQLEEAHELQSLEDTKDTNTLVQSVDKSQIKQEVIPPKSVSKMYPNGRDTSDILEHPTRLRAETSAEDITLKWPSLAKEYAETKEREQRDVIRRSDYDTPEEYGREVTRRIDSRRQYVAERQCESCGCDISAMPPGHYMCYQCFKHDQGKPPFDDEEIYDRYEQSRFGPNARKYQHYR